MTLKLFNTLSRKKELFKPIHKNYVGLYTCGPTVYNYAHIGNLRTYIFEDTLRRTLAYSGYTVKHVMNITDVGHLTSDEDVGQDKLEKRAKKEKKSVWDIAKFYTKSFLVDIKALNIQKAQVLAPATKHILQQIRLIQQLIKRGLAYETAQAIYFDVSKFKNYTKLSRQKLSEKLTGVRKEVIIDSEKKNPYDFALWFKAVGHFSDHTMRWPSPWGTGFPGWHLECSAISTYYLGQPFDIHTGGVDHINVHHTNEIAQSEAVAHKPLARYWLHGEFLLIDNSKMAKSEDNFFTIKTLTQKNINPLAFRYLVLGAHYRSQLNFTWESLNAAQTSIESLYDFVRELKLAKSKPGFGVSTLATLKKEFEKAISDDLNTPRALAALWNFIHKYHKNPSHFNPRAILAQFLMFDTALGLDFKNVKSVRIPLQIKMLAHSRQEARKTKNFGEADILRTQIQSLGWQVEDTAHGPHIKKL